MPREVHTFSGNELDDDRIERLFGGEVQQAMRRLYEDAAEEEWFTELCLYVPVNEYGVDAPHLYVGVDSEVDESGVETFDLLDDVKENQYPGLTYGGYYTDDTPVGLAMVVTPSHKPNNELDVSDML